jgi:glucose-6-phosphate isomerase
MDFQFEHSGIPSTGLARLKPELDRIKKQLRRGYLFESDRTLPLEKRQTIDRFITADGTPTFQAYKAEPAEVAKAAKRICAAYGKPKNVVVVGNGGSISSSNALYNALIEYGQPGKYARKEARLHIVDSQEPGMIMKVKRECDPDETVVLPISKSGNTQGVEDALDPFIKWGYNLAAVTSKGDRAGRLYKRVSEVLKKRRIDPEKLIIDHPPIGGRYTGRTPVGTLPIALLGTSPKDLKDLDKGAQNMYATTDPKKDIEENPALKLAASLYSLETDKGYTQIFAPMYGHNLEGFAHLTTQLLHESSCKLGRGQTILTATGPECQHHTNQRLFGGPANMAAVFFTVEKPQATGIKTSTGVPLEKALQFEHEGTRGDATARDIPNFTVNVKEMSPKEVGALLAFIQYGFGVYPSLLRDVNPFDHPQVETSKEISRNLRKRYLEKK